MAALTCFCDELRSAARTRAVAAGLTASPPAVMKASLRMGVLSGTSPATWAWKVIRCSPRCASCGGVMRTASPSWT